MAGLASLFPIYYLMAYAQKKFGLLSAEAVEYGAITIGVLIGFTLIGKIIAEIMTLSL
jgi:hypothetical protein